MEKEYLNKLRKNWKTVVLVLIITVILGLVLTFVQPLKYRASVELLVIQKQEQIVDPYVASRAAERLSKNLAQVIYTNSFFDKVMNSGFGIENDFSSDEIKKRKEWKKMIDTQVVLETGILKIDVYHKDKNQAVQIAQAIAYVLATKGDEYHGGGKDVVIKTIDTAVTSKYPAKPNIPVNLFTSLVLGILAGSGLVMLRSERKLELKKDIELIGNNHEDKTLVIRTDRVILETPNLSMPLKIKENLSFGREGLEEKKIIEPDNKENREFNLVPKEAGESKQRKVPSDGIWTMHDHLERLELSPEIV